jgi:hypothetical protein
VTGRKRRRSDDAAPPLTAREEREALALGPAAQLSAALQAMIDSALGSRAVPLCRLCVDVVVALRSAGCDASDDNEFVWLSRTF